MDQTLHNYLRVGLVHATLYPRARDDPAIMLAGLREVEDDPFFEAVEIGWQRDLPPIRVADALRASRLTAIYDVDSFLSGEGLDLSSGDDTLRGQAVAAVRLAIDGARAVGAARVNVVTGLDPGSVGRERAAEALVDSLCELADYAGAAGHPAVALKPLPRTGASGAFVGPTAEAANLARLVREFYPAVSLTLDTGHLAALGEDYATAFGVAAPHLRQVTLANLAPDRGDGALRQLDGGDYDVPTLAAALLALFRVGFLGTDRRRLVIFKAVPRSDEPPIAVISSVKQALLKAWEQL